MLGIQFGTFRPDSCNGVPPEIGGALCPHRETAGGAVGEPKRGRTKKVMCTAMALKNTRGRGDHLVVSPGPFSVSLLSYCLATIPAAFLFLLGNRVGI